MKNKITNEMKNELKGLIGNRVAVNTNLQVDKVDEQMLLSILHDITDGNDVFEDAGVYIGDLQERENKLYHNLEYDYGDEDYQVARARTVKTTNRFLKPYGINLTKVSDSEYEVSYLDN